MTIGRWRGSSLVLSGVLRAAEMEVEVFKIKDWDLAMETGNLAWDVGC